MKHPQWSIHTGDSVNKDPFTLAELDHGGTHKSAFPENPFFQRDMLRFKGMASAPGGRLQLLKGSPLLAASAQNAPAGQSGIGNAVGIDHGGIVDDLNAAPAGGNRGKITRWFMGKFNETSLFQMQFCEGVHFYGTAAAVSSGGDDNFAAA